MALDAIRKLFPGIGIEGAADDPKPDPKPTIDIDPATGKPKPKEPTDDPKSKDPLADFANIFDNKDSKDADPKDIPLSVAGVLTPETISKLVENLDFNSFISDETRNALAKGEDSNAIFTAFNEIARGSYQTAISHSSTLSEKILEDRLARFEKGLGERINKHQLQSNLSAHEVISKSPVLKAGISMLAERIQKSQPDADPKWVAEQATNYFLESAKLLTGQGQGSNPGPGEPGHKPTPGEDVDWMGFAMGDSVNNPGGATSDSGDTGDN
jgi:hypothetical protein